MKIITPDYVSRSLEVYDDFDKKADGGKVNYRVEKFKGKLSKKELDRLESFLHRKLIHPDYNYTTTTGLKQNFNPVIPPGAYWKLNTDYRNGVKVFEQHEEAYWRKKS